MSSSEVGLGPMSFRLTKDESADVQKASHLMGKSKSKFVHDLVMRRTVEILFSVPEDELRAATAERHKRIDAELEAILELRRTYGI